MVISAFPAIGKSYAYEKLTKTDKVKVLDSDSSKFSWLPSIEQRGTRSRNPEFPYNYIKHIKENMDTADYIFVSSHQVVRDAMRLANIPYTVVYPRRDMLAEIVGRCYLRGSSKDFITKLIENWDVWIDSCISDPSPKISINHNEYLLDILQIMNDVTQVTPYVRKGEEL